MYEHAEGVFHITTNRLAFVPNNTFPHSKMVWTSFDTIRSDLTISMTDRQDATANLPLPSTASLFQCFNLVRGLTEALRDDDSTSANFSPRCRPPQ